MHLVTILTSDSDPDLSYCRFYCWFSISAAYFRYYLYLPPSRLCLLCFKAQILVWIFYLSAPALLYILLFLFCCSVRLINDDDNDDNDDNDNDDDDDDDADDDNDGIERSTCSRRNCQQVH